ncbi:MAG: hypothetical protein ACJ8F7_15840 [Gemmataceae bacterium]
MSRFICVAIVALAMMGGESRADETRLRIRTVDEATYFHVTMPAPLDMMSLKPYRQAIDRIPLADLQYRPELMPQGDGLSVAVWRLTSDNKSLEFIGRSRAGGSITAKLHYPVERDGQAALGEKALMLDFATAAKADDDLAKLWATAQIREFAALERLSGGFDYFRFARQALARQYGVTDPMPRPAFVPPRKEPAARTVEASRLPDIGAAEHPWQQRLAGRKPVIEPLAKLTPYDFYYVRITNAQQLTTALDAAAGLLALLGQDPPLRERYDRQRCFAEDADGRPRLPAHVTEFALVGSDLQFHAGTDATILFRMSDEERFRAETDAAIRAKGKLEESRDEHRGVKVEHFTTPDREVSLHRAFVDGVAIVSNSPAAVQRVLDTRADAVTSLADTPDFHLFRAALPADAGEDALVYASESFLRRLLGPELTIKTRRRDEAMALVKALQYAARFIQRDKGRPPRDLAELASVAGCAPNDPRLTELGVTWDADHHQVLSKTWNTAAFATPLLEQPFAKVSADEETYYKSFRDDIQARALPALTPFGVRLKRTGTALHADAFAMPPARAATWEMIRKRLGQDTVIRPTGPPDAPARLVASFTTDAVDQMFVRDTLIKYGVDPNKLPVRHPGWMGDRLTLHLEAGPTLPAAVEYFLPQLLDPARPHGAAEDRYQLTRLPLTLGAEIRRPIVFVAWLTRLKDILMATFPSLLTWDALPGMYRGVKLNRVRPNGPSALLVFGRTFKEDEVPSLYYAYNNRALLLGPNEPALKRTAEREILPRERELNPRGPRANAVLDVLPSARPELSAAFRAVLERDRQRRVVAAEALRRAGFVAPTVEPPALPDVRRLSAELFIRPDGILLSTDIEH